MSYRSDRALSIHDYSAAAVSFDVFRIPVGNEVSLTHAVLSSAYLGDSHSGPVGPGYLWALILLWRVEMTVWRGLGAARQCPMFTRAYARSSAYTQ